MKKPQLLILLLAAFSLLFVSCGEYTTVLKSNDYEFRYEAAKALYAQGEYRHAAELFSLLLAPLKGTAYGEESLYMVAESNLKAKDYESAAMFFKKYYRSYPKGQYMEMARYNTGYSLYKQMVDVRLDQTSTMEAITEFQSFLDYCPQTTLRNQAQEIIYAMQDKLVQKEYLSAKLYYDLGTYTINSIYGGNNYEACVVTAQNALKDYPYASAPLREALAILVLRAKYYLAKHSVEEKRVERFRDTVDEYYAFQNDFPESSHMKDANFIFDYAERVIAKKGVLLDDDEIRKEEKKESPSNKKVGKHRNKRNEKFQKLEKSTILDDFNNDALDRN